MNVDQDFVVVSLIADCRLLAADHVTSVRPLAGGGVGTRSGQFLIGFRRRLRRGLRSL